MNVYLYCVHSTFIGVVLAEDKQEAKEKVINDYINSSDIIVIDPLDRDIMIEDRYEINDLFSYTSIREQKAINENRIMKDGLNGIMKSIQELTR